MITYEAVVSILSKRAAEGVPSVSAGESLAKLTYADDATHAARVSLDVEALRSVGGHPLASSESDAPNTVTLRYGPKAEKTAKADPK